MLFVGALLSLREQPAALGAASPPAWVRPAPSSSAPDAAVSRGAGQRAGQSDYDRAETIEETADLVTQLGGTGIAIQVDHLDGPAQWNTPAR
jgi:hypothetical protein